jgi:hypothetical protein
VPRRIAEGLSHDTRRENPTGPGYRRVASKPEPHGLRRPGPGASWVQLLCLPSHPVRISVGNLPFRGSLLWVPMPSRLSEQLFAVLFGRARTLHSRMLAGS